MNNRGNKHLYAVSDDKRLDLLKGMLTATIEYIKEKKPPVDVEAKVLVVELADLIGDKDC